MHDASPDTHTWHLSGLHGSQDALPRLSGVNAHLAQLLIRHHELQRLHNALYGRICRD